VNTQGGGSVRQKWIFDLHLYAYPPCNCECNN
jgi:hypothetical protein